MNYARRFRPLAGLVITSLVAVGVLGSATAAGAAYNPSSPPYPVDPDNSSSLLIYDATSGAQVTQGSTSTALNNYYFIATSDFAPGQTKATIQGYLAEQGKAPGAWSGTGLGAATTYPVTTSTAPANVKAATTPTARGASTSSFGSLAGGFPNTAASTSDFYQLYQLRLVTTFPDTSVTKYAFSDVQVDTTAGTWKQVNPAPAVVTAPGAPTGVSANAGDAAATVSFTAPASNGGSAITGYTVTSSPGGITASGSGSPITVTGLTNGTAYTFTVTATNSAGTGSPSAASNSVTPTATPTAPGAPTGVSAVAGDTAATVSFTAPSSNGSAITGYTVTSSPGGVTATGSASPITVTGLTNGTAYTFTVTATNSVGTSAPSAASNSVTPFAATVPGAPTGVTATPANSSALVSWTAPADNGGAAISGYTVLVNGTASATVTGTSTTVTGLTNGTTYSITVTANNSKGSSAASAPVTVTPRTVAGAPTGVTATPGDTTVAVTFTAPASNGGSTVTGYTVTASATGVPTVSVDTATTSATLTGLVNGASYTVSVVAKNGAGSSPAGTATATPFGKPATPAKPTGASGDQQVTVSFVAPSSNGSAIIGYTVTASPGGATATGTSSPIVVTGLTNDTAYTFTVTATNAAGDSAPSPASDPVTPGIKTATSATLTTSAAKVLIGRTVTLTGKVTGVSGTGTVVLRTFNDHAAATDKAFTVTDGAFSYTFAPTRNASYALVFAGDSTHLSSTSGRARTLVVSKVGIGTIRTAGGTVTVTGRVSPGVKGQSVYLQERTSTGYRNLTRVVTDSAGRFTVTVRILRGQHTFRLASANSPLTLGSTSAATGVRVV